MGELAHVTISIGSLKDTNNPSERTATSKHMPPTPSVLGIVLSDLLRFNLFGFNSPPLAACSKLAG